MDPIKKRKIDANGLLQAVPGAFNPLMLALDDAIKIVELLTHEQLSEIVRNALLRHPDVLDAARLIADRDVAQRKLFIRGLGWETTTEKLRALFSSYGELDEAVVILDKVTGKSKGFGFITFKHVDGAIMALKEPSKKIDGRMTVTQLAAAGNTGGGGGAGAGGGGFGGVNNSVDVSTRKIYVANVPYDMPSDRLLRHFSMYGEIEEGPLGFDKATGKSKGFALFVYKTTDDARASLVDPVKNIDGHQLNCKLATEGKKGKPPAPMGVQGANQGNGEGIGAPGRHYGDYSGSLGAGGPRLSAGPNSGVNGGFGGPYAVGSHYVRPMGTAYGGVDGAGSGLGSGSGLGGDGYVGAGSGMGAAGRGSSMHGFPPGSAGDYKQGAQYGGYLGRYNQPAGALSAPRAPPGRVYQGMHPYH